MSEITVWSYLACVLAPMLALPLIVLIIPNWLFSGRSMFLITAGVEVVLIAEALLIYPLASSLLTPHTWSVLWDPPRLSSCCF